MERRVIILVGVTVLFMVITLLSQSSFGDEYANPGDFEPDGDVDLADFAIFRAAWLSVAGGIGWNPACDISDPNDEVIDILDLLVLGQHWLYYYLPPIDPTMVFITGGEFEMGDHSGEGYLDERPIHFVYVDSFYMSAFEITNQEYCDFLNDADIKVVGGIVYAVSDDANDYPYLNTYSADSHSQITYSGVTFSSRSRDDYSMGDHPVVEVSWYGAAAYCNGRSVQEGYEQCYNLSSWECDFSRQGYLLATEAQWEYAARGECYLPYYKYPWCSNDIDCLNANHWDFWGSGDYCNPLGLSSFPYTSPVGYYGANNLGLYDMTGNVSEWCNDWYDYSYYSISPYDNPPGPVSGTDRVLRGGGWDYHADICRMAYRSRNYPDNRNYDHGFRIVLDLE